MGDAQPDRWRVEGGLEDLGAPEPPHGLGPAGPGPVGQSLQATTRIPAPAGDDGRPRDPDPLSDLGVGGAVGGQQQIRARWASTAGSWLDRAHRRSSARSSGAMGSGATAGMQHARTSRHTVKRLQRRSTSGSLLDRGVEVQGLSGGDRGDQGLEFGRRGRLGPCLPPVLQHGRGGQPGPHPT